MVSLLDEEGIREKLRQRINSRDWWVIFPMTRIDVLEDIERSFYSGKANVDFEILMGPNLPGFAIALAKKSHMSVGMLAGKLGVRDESQFRGRDIIQFGEEGERETGIRQVLAFVKWLGPL